MSGAELRLAAARALAWALLLGGWVGLGAMSLALSPSLLGLHVLVAAWLVLLGVAATFATRDNLRARTRCLALVLCAVLTAGALARATQGGGMPALLLALCGWAGLAALASGVVRSLRLAQVARPAPPVAAAGLGALCAALAIGDPAHAQGLAFRLGLLVVLAACALVLLQAEVRTRDLPSGCRAGLFDCSLPAWPAGAWHDARQWPTLLAGLAMLPMMAALPLMVAWCRTEAIAPQAMVLLHFAAMFLPALLLRGTMAHWHPRALPIACTALLFVGGLMVLWADAPYNFLGVALAQGAAWSLAWAGQLWSPQRRSQQGTSPLRAALGYAAVTMVVGVAVQSLGPAGLALAQAGLGFTALLAWGYLLLRHPDAHVPPPARRPG